MDKAGTQNQPGTPQMIAFARLTKVDEEKRLVYGRAAQQVPDRADEELDYAQSKPYFERWSKSQLEASLGKSAGNVRGMHGKIAAGILIPQGGLQFNDAEKAIDVVTHVVDDNEWQKVLKGAYTGFSIGGKYVKKSPVDKRGIVSYVADPSEISLVDRPAIPTATFFEVHKSDGKTEKVEFLTKINKPRKETRDGKTVVVDEDGHVYGEHDSEESADKQLAALYASKGREEGKADKPEMVKLADVAGRPLGLEVEKAKLPKQGESFEAGGRTFAFVKIEKDAAFVEPVYEVSGSEEDLAEFSKAVGEAKLTIKDVTALVKKAGEPTAEQLAQKALETRARDLCKADGKNGDDLIKLEAQEEQPIWKTYLVKAEAAIKKDARAALFKSAIEELGKADHPDAKQDAQIVHDALLKMGAKCAKEASAGGEITKLDDAALEKMIAPLIEKKTAPLLEKIAKLEAMPMPSKVQLALRAVRKEDDNAGGTPVTKFDVVRDDFGRVDAVATMVKALQGGPTAQRAFMEMVDPDGKIKE